VNEKLPASFQSLLSRGFTKLMSAGDYWPEILRFKHRLDAGELNGLRQFVVGAIGTIRHASHV
jgi:hypothetical protein